MSVRWAPSATPGGTLPLMATKDPATIEAAIAATTSCHSLSRRGGPGSLITVVLPPASMTTVVPRISPSTATAVTSSPSAWSRSVATRPSRPGNGPTSRAVWPSVNAARQTLTALPPAVTATWAARSTCPGTSAGSRIVRSIVWLRPTTSIDASPLPLRRRPNDVEGHSLTSMSSATQSTRSLRSPATQAAADRSLSCARSLASVGVLR